MGMGLYEEGRRRKFIEVKSTVSLFVRVHQTR